MVLCWLCLGGPHVTLPWLCCMLMKPEEGAQTKALFAGCDGYIHEADLEPWKY